MSKRCSCFAITTNRICKKKFLFVIQGKKCCSIHAKYEFNKYAIYIQKCWKGYRLRYIVQNVYVKLPSEIQKKIMFYVRENDLIKKYHHDVISRILDTKCYYLNLINILDIFYIPNIDHYENLNKVIYLYKLYTKYSIIVPKIKLNILYKLSTRFMYLSHVCNFNKSDELVANELAYAVRLFKNSYDYLSL